MLKAKESEKGVVTLEACICVLSFLILMLLLSSLFVMFMAQNKTAHTVLQTSESLSLDAYATESIGTPGTDSVSEIVLAITEFIKKYAGVEPDNPNYVGKDKLNSVNDAELMSILKKRFVGYLTGGDESEADELLKNMNVVEGLDGLDFSESYVQNNTLYIVLKYNLEYDFNIWNIGEVAVKQTTCSKIWNSEGK